MILALTVAVIADGLQIGLGPLGLFPADQIIDVLALVITSWLLGFHVLLLPTFVLELIPLADMLPTWTGCVVAVIALRKRGQREGASSTGAEQLLMEKDARSQKSVFPTTDGAMTKAGTADREDRQARG